MSLRSAWYRVLLFLCGAMLSLAISCGGGGTIYTVTKNPPPSIGSPASISAVAGSGSVTVSWSLVTGATSYNVYSSMSATVSKATGTKHSVTGTTFNDTGLTNGLQYYYVMTSVKSGIESPDSSVVSAVPGSTGNISGRITYEDKELGANPSVISGHFTGSTSMKAVRYAAVDVVDAANPNIPLYTTWTNSLGMYSLPTATGSTSVYIRVNSEALPTGGTQPITVKNLLNANTKYGVPSTNLSLAGSANVNITIPTTNIAAGAFNILDVMTTGYDFIKYLSGNYPIVPLDVFWYPGNPDGTYFCTGGGCPATDGIYVLSQTGGDTDEYDDDVLWHEFGHFAASNYSLDDSPGGIHYLGANDQDLRLSWSEGWGDFFPGAVKTWLNSTGQSNLISSAPGVTLTTYVDTSGSGGFSFDFGNPTVNSSYSSNEVAVAKLLTDLNNTFTIQDVWSVVADFKATLPPLAQPVNLELFWDRWLSVTIPDASQITTLETIYNTRSINYAIDDFEGDNTIATAQTYTAAGSPQIHTLYATGDEDFMRFTATSSTHTITAGNLINGADTFLSLYDQSHAPVTSNDNAVQPAPYPPNNMTALSSRIIYPSFIIGNTYYVSVKSAPSRPASAGKYGTYTLTISP